MLNIMPLKIHWKGSPHHHLPRIRFASKSRVSSHNRSHANAAAENVLTRTLSSQLVRERKKARFGVGKNRSARSSRSSCSAVRTKHKRDTRRAREHIQMFGWDMHQAHLASRSSGASTVTRGRHNVEPPPAKSTAEVPSGQNPEDTVTHSTLTTSNDGAVSSCMRKPKVERPEERYSLMHVTEVPVYWSSSKRAAARKKIAPLFNKDYTPMATKHASEYAHVGSLGTVSRQKPSRSPQDVMSSRTYDRRIDPYEAKQESQRQSTKQSRKKSSSAPAAREKRKSEATIRRKTDPAKSRGSRFSSQSMKSAINSILSDAKKRSPSQVKAIRYFTKELELYLQATQSLPKKSLVPSPSATTVSANTIEEFKPYQAEFGAAGLAVTSDEQRGQSTPTETSEDQAPPTPPKDEKWKPKKSLGTNSKLSQAPSAMPTRKAPETPTTTSTATTATTEMEWTPPHEVKTREKKKVPSPDPTTSTTPSPPSETLSPTSTRSPARSITKKSLPWLRASKTPTKSSASPTTASGSGKLSEPSQKTPVFSTPGANNDSPKSKLSISATSGKSKPLVPASENEIDSSDSTSSVKTVLPHPSPTTEAKPHKSMSSAKTEFSCTAPPSKAQSHKPSSSAKTEFSCKTSPSEPEPRTSIATSKSQSLSKKGNKPSAVASSLSVPKDSAKNGDGEILNILQ